MKRPCGRAVFGGRLGARRSEPAALPPATPRPSGRRTARGLPALLVCAALLPPACRTTAPAGVRDEPHAGIVSLWRSYLEMPPERALAVAGDPDRHWVGAASGGHPTRDEAEEAVLIECRARRAVRRMQAECRLYAVGSEIVWRAP